MANNQITPFQLTDQFTMDNFNQRINETNTALQKKADLDESGKVPSSQLPSMGYSKEEVISDTTKSLFGLSSDAVPDDAFAEIHRRFSGISIDLLWETPAPNSAFYTGTVAISNIADYKGVFVEFKDLSGSVQSNATGFVFSENFQTTVVGFNTYARIRMFQKTSDGVHFSTAYRYDNGMETEDITQLVPRRIYGIKI